MIVFEIVQILFTAPGPRSKGKGKGKGAAAKGPSAKGKTVEENKDAFVEMIA